MKGIGISNTVETPLFITPWSYIHFIASSAFFLYFNMLFKNALIAGLVLFLVHTIYEFKDYYTTYMNKKIFRHEGKDTYRYSFFKDNTLENSIGDTIFSIFGMFFAYMILRLFPKHTMKIFELVSIAAISSFIIFVFFKFD